MIVVMEIEDKFVPLIVGAEKLGIPLAWLRAEVRARRLPALHAGRRWLVSLEAVRNALAAQSRAESGVRDGK